MNNSGTKSNKLNWSNLISIKRLKCQSSKLVLEDDKNNEYSNIRTPFQRDYDRIIFSQAFRKLGGKTQVHPLSDNDTIHTRLTHSLETASVGRSLAFIVGDYLKNVVNEKNKPENIAAIVQSACLAHDLGNPPFGHAGEDAIANWFIEYFEKEGFKLELDDDYKKEFEVFDGNAQGFRLASKIENNFKKGGLNLTVTILASMIKYPHFAESKDDKKFSIYRSEKQEFEMIMDNFDLRFKREDKYDKNDEKTFYVRHPLSYLMEASDDICYTFLDIVDAIELKILRLDDLKNFFVDAIKSRSRVEDIYLDNYLNDTRKAAKLSALAINELTLNAGNTFNNNLDRFTSKSEIYKIKDLISLGTETSKIISDAKKIANDYIFPENSKQKLEIAAYEILGAILNDLVNAVVELDNKDDKKISFKSKKILDLMGICKPAKSESLYEKLRLVLDFVSGMTDRYAITLFQQLNGIGYQFKRM